MTRSERLLNLLQVLRQHRTPVSARSLAEATGVSIRTLYRDIAALQAQGASIEGEPGVGYLMKPGFMLPPLMFTSAELDALALGMRWVAQNDQQLAASADGLLAKIAAVLPQDLRAELFKPMLFIGAKAPSNLIILDPDVLRRAIRAEHKLKIAYQDPDGERTERVIWPFALVYFEQTRVLMSWCELREDFRNFRLDRIVQVEYLPCHYPKYRQQLLAEWRKLKYVPMRSILP